LTKSRIDTGKAGEALAVRHLQREGYRIVERNYRCVFGEMDIIAREGGTFVFVEVKSRRSVQFGDPKYAVDQRKQRKMSAVALCYLKEKRLLDHPARFDVVTVLFSEEGPRLELARNAFSLIFP
jgi:putative endonuclease